MKIRAVLAALGTVMLFSVGVSAHESGVVAMDEASEIESLARNVDTAIQACGVYFRENKPSADRAGNPLKNVPLAFPEEPSPYIATLTPTFDDTRWYRWFDPHAQIWLVGSVTKPMCRIAVSNSEYVSKIGSQLFELVQVGNFWRPATDAENPLAAEPETPEMPIRTVFAADPIAGGTLRPVLIIVRPKEGMVLKAGQQMLITVMLLSTKMSY